MSRYYDKNSYSPVSRTQYIGAQKAETEISPETEQSSPQIAPEKSPKPKGKEKQLYHWCHTRGSHHGVIEGFFAKNDRRQSISLRRQQARTVGTNRGKNRIQILVNMSNIVGMESLLNSLNVVVYHVGLVLRMPHEVFALSSRGVAFSPDGQILASRCFGRVLHLWDTETVKPSRTFEGRLYE